MYFGNKRGIVSILLAGCLLFTAEFEVFAADPQSEAQAIETVNYDDMVSPLEEALSEIPAMASIAVNTQEWAGKALANTDKEADIYAKAGGKVVGKMYSNTIVTVLEEGTEWTKISSGSVVGYVKNETLLFGSAAVERASVTCANGTQDAKTVKQIAAEVAAEKKKADEVELLAALIYCEAGNQSYEGKVAVGAVVMNRMESKRFPNTLEKVIYQRGQFTPAMTGKLGRVLSSGRVPGSCYDAARDALNGADPVNGALFFSTGGGGYKLGDHYFR